MQQATLAIICKKSQKHWFSDMSSRLEHSNYNHITHWYIQYETFWLLAGASPLGVDDVLTAKGVPPNPLVY